MALRHAPVAVPHAPVAVSHGPPTPNDRTLTTGRYARVIVMRVQAPRLM
jgi:hypothetical protein